MNNKNNNKGFTLIELIIAISILSIVLAIGYNIINKNGSFINLQQYITKNQSVANLVNTYFSKDIEESKSVSGKEKIDDSTYRYMITKVNKSVEYRIVLGNKNGKKVYNLIRNDGDSSIEIISNQVRDSDEPFLVNLKNNKIYEIKILYSENNKLKEYSFDVSSRLSSNNGGNTSDGENGGGSGEGDNDDDLLKPTPGDIPSLPEGVGPNTHFIGFWMVDPDKQKQNNVYTWIDNSVEKGTSSKQENSISASISPGSENAYEYSCIENTKVEGNITSKSKVEFLSIYVSKGTEVQDFEIKSKQSTGSITVLNNFTRDSSNGKFNLTGGANDGIWYTCQISGNVDSFEITSGKLSTNNTTDTGFILIVYSEKPQDYGDADIIIDFQRNYEEPHNSNQFHMTNTIKVRDGENSYKTEDSVTRNDLSEKIHINFSNHVYHNPAYIQAVVRPELDDTIISYLYGKDIKKTNKIILTLEGNINLEKKDQLKPIIPNKQYEVDFKSGYNFDDNVIISGLSKGDVGRVKINFVVD